MQSLSEGNHRFTWVAETQLSPFWDIYFPAGWAALGAASEAKNGSTFTKTAGGQFSESSARRARSLSNELKRIAYNLGEAAAITGAEQANNNTPGFLGDEEASAEHSHVQNLLVWDVHPPEFHDPDSGAIIESQAVSMEATDFGGARFNRIRNSLAARFDTVDACGKRVTLRPVNPPSLIEIGMPVEMITRKIRSDGDERGLLVYGYKFRPLVSV